MKNKRLLGIFLHQTTPCAKSGLHLHVFQLDVILKKKSQELFISAPPGAAHADPIESNIGRVRERNPMPNLKSIESRLELWQGVDIGHASTILTSTPWQADNDNSIT